MLHDCSPAFLSEIPHPVTWKVTRLFSFHPVCCFKNHLRICFLCFGPPLVVFFFFFWASLLNTRDRNRPNSEKWRRKYAMSSAHPPKTAVCVDGGAPGACVCMFCMCVSRPVYLWVTERAWRVCSGRWTLMQPASAHPPPAHPNLSASRLRWLAAPAGVINLPFPLHNQSRRAKVEALHDIKLSETSYKGSSWMLRFQATWIPEPPGPRALAGLWLPLVGTRGGPAAVWLCKPSHRGALNHAVRWAEWT